MALSSGKQITVFFDRVLEAFEAMTTMADESNVDRPDRTTAQNSSDVFWKPEAQIGDIQSGLDQSGNQTDVLELNVPTIIDTIDNDTFSLTSLELRDKRFMERRADAAAIKLSAELNKNVANLVANTGTLVIDRAVAPSGFGDVSICKATMDRLEIMPGRSMFLNSTHYNDMADNLANKDRSPRVEEALADAKIGNFASFATFDTNFQPVLPASSNPTVTITGAQFHVPVGSQTSAGSTFPLDNRGMNLVVSTTTGVAVGDAFTIPGVNEVSHISKIDTGRLRHFRVVAITDGTNMVVYPRIVPLDEVGSGLTRAQGTYANVTTEAPAAATISWVNTSAETVSSFWKDGSVEITAGQIAWDAEMFKGANFMRETTSSGIEIVMAVEGTAMSGVVNTRLTTFYGITNLDPQQNGIMGKFS